MLVYRENNPNKMEWIDEIYQEGNYHIVYRKESGDWEVYYGRKSAVRFETYEEAYSWVKGRGYLTVPYFFLFETFAPPIMKKGGLKGLCLEG